MFTTERLKLRVFELDDKDFLYELDNSKVVNKYRSTDKRTIEFCIGQINKWRFLYGNDLLNVYLLEHKDTIESIGLIFLVRKDNNRVELGYRLLDKYWGKRYCTEPSIVLLTSYFKFTNDNVYAETHAENMSSIKLLTRLGFKEIKYNQDYNCREFLLEKELFKF